jgi:hypothetical protein
MEMIFDSCFPESQVRSPCNLASTDRSPHPPTHPHSSYLLLVFVTIFPSFDSSKNEGENAFKLMVFSSWITENWSIWTWVVAEISQVPNKRSVEIPQRYHSSPSLCSIFSRYSLMWLHRLQLHLFSIHQNTSTPPKMSMHFHGVSSSETPVVDVSVGFKILHYWLIRWRWWWFSHTRFEPGSVSMFCLQMCQLQMCCSEWCTSMAQRQYLTLSSHYWSSCILFWQWKISRLSFAPMRILQMIL